jgi:ABC-type transport system involved in multi-copper enzyme maturation permease subunit
LYEVLAAYLGLVISIVMFGTISVFCSGLFRHNIAALIVSYLIILPMALFGVSVWIALAEESGLRLFLTTTIMPIAALSVSALLVTRTARRMLYPPDIGSEGKEVVSPEEEERELVGLVIRRDKFPDRLFAPPKRTELLPDGANPIYEKEIQAEIFSQGTLMLRLVIQISMLLAIPLMAAFIFFMPGRVAWYVLYTMTFTILVSPAFLAGSITSERERQTLDLLLTTNIAPSQILWGKLIAGLRVASVLTAFLLWPLVLGCGMVSFYWRNPLGIAAMVVTTFLTCGISATLGLLCSVLFRKTTTSLICTYALLVVLCFGPMALNYFAFRFYRGTDIVDSTAYLFRAISPFTAVLEIPLSVDSFDLGMDRSTATIRSGSWYLWWAHLLFLFSIGCLMLRAITWLFHRRWRVSQSVW